MKSRVAVAVASREATRIATLHSWALSSLIIARICDETHSRRDINPRARRSTHTRVCESRSTHTRVCESRARDRPIGSRARIGSRRDARSISWARTSREREETDRAGIYIIYIAPRPRARARRRATGRDARHADRIARARDGRPTTRERGRRATRETAIERDRTKDARGDDDDADVAGDAGNRCG